MWKSIYSALVLLLALGVVLPAAAQSDEEIPLVAGNTTFAFDLYRQIHTQDGNLFFSPYSISAAVALAYAGAGGDTAAQIAYALHFPPDAGETLAQAAALQSELTTPRMMTTMNESGAAEETEGFALRIANAIWAQQNFPWLPDYVALTEGAGAPLRSVDFTADPEAMREAINQWVEDQTEDKIQDLLPPSTIDELTRMVIANAVYFKASWHFPFSESLTQDGDFTLLDGSTVSAPMMAMDTTERLRYAQADGYTAVMLPYADGTLDMLIVMPDAGEFDTFESGLTPEQYASIDAALTMGQVNLTMPRFTFEQSLDLSETLSALGMADAFDPDRADFSRMYDQGVVSENLYISAALHKAFIAVDEAGTEAAAATALVMALASAALDEPVAINLDRPFVFFINDRVTGSILFAGRVVDPTS